MILFRQDILFYLMQSAFLEQLRREQTGFQQCVARPSFLNVYSLQYIKCLLE